LQAGGCEKPCRSARAKPARRTAGSPLDGRAAPEAAAAALPEGFQRVPQVAHQLWLVCIGAVAALDVTVTAESQTRGR